MEIKNVCIVNNLYCLLIYLLLKDEKELDETFFFWGNSISNDITNKFINGVRLLSPKSFIGKLLFVLKTRYITRSKYSFLKTAKIYGQDNMLITPPLLANRKMTVIEDGLANYTIISPKRKFGWIKGFLISPLMAQGTLGYSTSVEKIYLTGIGIIPIQIKNKVELINLRDMWSLSSARKRSQILSTFNIDIKTINDFKSVDTILLTQPISEDKIVTEKDKIDIYKKIIGNQSVAIKPHPRESTDYKKYFPHVKILKNGIPLELLILVGVNFKKVLTIFSTSALSIPGNPEICFTGTKIHPALIKAFGDVRLIDNHIIVD